MIISIKKLFQTRRFSQADTPSDLVLNIQFEILKLLSEKDDLIKENEVLKHYRQSYMRLQEENTELREAIQTLTGAWVAHRTEPDGMEQGGDNREQGK